MSDSFILPRLEATAMGITVAISAERDSSVLCFVTAVPHYIRSISSGDIG